MMNRQRLDTWGGALFALIGLTACGGISETDESSGGSGGAGGAGSTGGTGGTGATSGIGANGGTGSGGIGANGGTASAGMGGIGAVGGGGGLEYAGPCDSDDDCSSGRRCVEWTANISSLVCTSGSVCETALDQCQSNADCGSVNNCVPDGNYVRICKSPGCAIGRPFLVGGITRTAPSTERVDWIAREALAAADPNDDELREVLYEHWLLAARMEHASVAAFARFGLTLIALGAPSDLMLQCAQAMQDETVHAELCFGLASRYGETVVGPAPLAVDRALEDVTLAAALENTLIEGCIGETLAAAEAQAASEHVKDPVVRAILERIAADETRHAALAFRFVAWALAQGEPRCAELVRRTLEERVQLSAETTLNEAPEAALLAAGVLPAQHRSEVRRYAYETIVLRALRGLLNEPETTLQRASC